MVDFELCSPTDCLWLTKRLEEQSESGVPKQCDCTFATTLEISFPSSFGAPTHLGTIPGKVLASMVHNVPGRLTKLRLYDVRAMGSFPPIAQALAGCKYLESFFVVYSNICESPEDMITLGETLAQLQLIEVVLMGTIQTSTQREKGPWKCLLPMIQNPSQVLRIITVTSFDGDENCAECSKFLTIAGESHKLKSLELKPSNHRLPSKALQEMILATTFLETLQLDLSSSSDVVGVARSMRHNDSIKKLDIGNERSLNEYLPMSPEDVKAEVDAFRDTLQEHDNFTLKDLEVNPWFPNLPDTEDTAHLAWKIKEIKFNLTLNKAGRAHLLTSTSSTSDEWMGAIADQDDPGIIHYFLRRNPSLCFADPNYKKNSNEPTPSPWAKFMNEKGDVHSTECPSYGKGKAQAPEEKGKGNQPREETHPEEDHQAPTNSARTVTE